MGSQEGASAMRVLCVTVAVCVSVIAAFEASDAGDDLVAPLVVDDISLLQQPLELGEVMGTRKGGVGTVAAAEAQAGNSTATGAVAASEASSLVTEGKAKEERKAIADGAAVVSEDGQVKVAGKKAAEE